jgi:hypothetical protein
MAGLAFKVVVKGVIDDAGLLLARAGGGGAGDGGLGHGGLRRDGLGVGLALRGLAGGFAGRFTGAVNADQSCYQSQS